MRKKITVELSSKGIETLIKEVHEHKKLLQEKTPIFLKRLADEGCNIASVSFKQAQYDGDNDVSVSVEERDKTTVAVVAAGSATLFIEFGTGINYPDNHPESAKHGMVRGNYGYKLGRLKFWRYKGSAGSHGAEIIKGKHKGEIITKGNPAGMSMYNAIKELEGKFAEIAREVFK